MVKQRSVNNMFGACLVYVLLFVLCSVPSSSAQRHSYPLRNGTSTVQQHNGQLERIHGQINALRETDQELLRQLQQIDLRLAQLENNNVERWNNVAEDIKDVTHNTENLSHMTARVDQTIQLVRADIDNINTRLSRDDSTGGSPVREAPGKELDIPGRLDILATLLQQTRNGVARLEDSMNVVYSNVSQLNNQLRMVQMMQFNLPTKQYLQGLFQAVRSVNHGSPFVDGFSRTSALPATCLEDPLIGSGILKIQPTSESTPFYVRCDGSTENGGWIVILNRQDGSMNFRRGWDEYKNGFGNLEGEFFIGLDKLHELTSARLHELYVGLEDFNNGTAYARYATFAIGTEQEGYPLSILGQYEGTAGDSLRYSAGWKFSTIDRDNDGWVEGSCAQSHTGAWWYNACERSHLFGQYLKGNTTAQRIFQGMFWEDFRGATYSLKNAAMMIRPVDQATIIQQ